MHMQQAALMAPQRWKNSRLHQTEQWLLAATSAEVHVYIYRSGASILPLPLMRDLSAIAEYLVHNYRQPEC